MLGRRGNKKQSMGEDPGSAKLPLGPVHFEKSGGRVRRFFSY